MDEREKALESAMLQVTQDFWQRFSDENGGYN